jgi:hypothetical protein
MHIEILEERFPYERSLELREFKQCCRSVVGDRICFMFQSGGLGLREHSESRIDHSDLTLSMTKQSVASKSFCRL